MTRDAFEHAVRAAGAVLGVDALCLELHDLWISKGIANRQKDIEFCQALLETGIVDSDELRTRLGLVVDLPQALRRTLEARIPAARA